MVGEEVGLIMILIVSHFTNNKGTTDYFRDFLLCKNRPHYYLRHPFSFTDIKKSQLIYFDGNKEVILKEYNKFNNEKLDLIRNFFLSLFIAFKYGKKIKKVFAFGSFNTVPFLLVKYCFRNKVIFWGVDYSTKRFKNILLNKFYLWTETISCKYSDGIIQPTKRQEDARIKYHNLNKEKSLIIPNGTAEINFNKDFSIYDIISFIYIGSITAQHGILDFIKYFYLKKNIDSKLYIFGGGELENELRKLIKENGLKDKVIFFGFKKQSEIIDFLDITTERLFGIAPYNDSKSDHTFFIDSLKIKEYLNYNIPFVISNISYISDSLKNSGIIYKDYSEIFEKISGFNYNLNNIQKFKSDFYWKNILNKIKI